MEEDWGVDGSPGKQAEERDAKDRRGHIGRWEFLNIERSRRKLGNMKKATGTGDSSTGGGRFVAPQTPPSSPLRVWRRLF